ncbi:uncharacterized protein KY384_000914 [Bacidia gigantensis]|uniref:uncharacterized protein n=1 Tax=Bacidia gigantensis TaxID=2732470 RepID=UPI001D046193|nr:uncharacterized protein KY384_000914 [Bacidia gigantensis]KAG8534071.1 hypothetical protein KY384_000914 [Bacidia gigantensis]
MTYLTTILCLAFSATLSSGLAFSQTNASALKSLDQVIPLQPSSSGAWRFTGSIDTNKELSDGLESDFLLEIEHDLGQKPQSILVSPTAQYVSFTGSLDAIKVECRWLANRQRLTYGESLDGIQGFAEFLDLRGSHLANELEASIFRNGVRVISVHITDEFGEEVEFATSGALDFNGKIYPERQITGGAAAVNELLRRAKADAQSKSGRGLVPADWEPAYQRHNTKLWFVAWHGEDFTYDDVVDFIDAVVDYYREEKVYGTLRGFGEKEDGDVAFSIGLESQPLQLNVNESLIAF